MIRKVRVDDIDQILEIEQADFDNPWNRDQFLYEINENPYSNIYVIEIDGVIIGYYDLWIIFEHGEIANIAVKNQYHHQGYGSMMMEHLEKQAMDNCCETLSLEVRVNNQEAIDLYKKYDFSVVNIKKGYYKTKDGSIDAYFMMKGI